MKTIKERVVVLAHTLLMSGLLVLVLGGSAAASPQLEFVNQTEVSVGHYYINTPAVGDLDGDGLPDIVTSATGTDSQGLTSGAIVVGLDHNLAPLPGWPIVVEGNGLMPPTPPVIADLDGDGRAEVLIGFNSQFCVFTGDGQLLWKKSVDEIFKKRAEVVDIDGDGWPEIVAPAERYTGQAKVYLWHWNGDPLPGSPLTLNEFYASPPAVYRHNQQTLIAVGGGNGFAQPEGALYLFAFERIDPTPHLRWRQPVGQHPIAQPVFVDLDQDGTPDILGGTYTPSVYAVSSVDGHALAGWPQPVGGSVFTSPTVLENNGQAWIFAIGLDGSLHAWDDRGRLQWILPVVANAIEKMTLADVNEDGQLDIVLGVNGGVIATDLQGRVIHYWPIGNCWVTSALSVEMSPGQRMIILGGVDNVTERAKLILLHK